jgi:hypothetical protein
MRPVWEITTIVLRIWVAGFLLMTLISVSDFAFRRPHRAGILLKRLGLGAVWPLALVSSQGRHALFGRFSGV